MPGCTALPLYDVPTCKRIFCSYLKIVVSFMFNFNNFKYNACSSIFMNIKDFLKPTVFKTAIFIFFGVIFLYFVKESISAIGFSFAIFYNAYGFPFQYLITGDISNLSGIINTLSLGNFFYQI